MKPGKVIFSCCAMRAMERLSSKDQLEHGGVLVGRRADNDIVIMFALGPGRSAKRTYGGFEYCANEVKPALNAITSIYRSEFYGFFHSHPAIGYSQTDLKTMRDVVTSSEWNKIEAIFPIFETDSGGNPLCMRVWYLHEDLKKPVEVPWIEGSCDNGPLMSSLQEDPLGEEEDVINLDALVSFIANELQKAGYRVKLSVGRRGSSIIISRKRKQLINILFPLDYPQHDIVVKPLQSCSDQQDTGVEGLSYEIADFITSIEGDTAQISQTYDH